MVATTKIAQSPKDPAIHFTRWFVELIRDRLSRHPFHLLAHLG